MPDRTGRVVMTGRLWAVVAVGFGVMFLSSSIKGAYQVYFRDLAALFDVGRGQFALTGALFGLCLGLVSPVVGAVCDRYGPYRSMISGALVAALAFVLLGLFQSYALFLLAYGLLAAYALAAMTFVPMGVWIDSVFGERHKGLAYAAVSNGVAIGFIVLSPAWVWLNGWLPWSTLAMFISAGFLLLVLLPLAWAARYLPVRAEHGGTGIGEAHDHGIVRRLRSPLFLLLAISFAGCGSSMAFIDIHFAPMVQEASGPDLAGNGPTLALALSLLGVFELAGAMVVGYLAGCTSPAAILALLYALRGLALALLALFPSGVMTVLFAAVFGATYMGTVILTSLVCLKAYGAAIKGRMFGLLFTIHQLAVAATAWLGGLAHDMFGSYTLTTLGVAAFCGLSVIAAIALQQVLGEQPRQTEATGSQQTPVPMAEPGGQRPA